MKTVQPIIASNGVSYLQMASVELHSTSGREKEGKGGGFNSFSNDNERNLEHKIPIIFNQNHELNLEPPTVYTSAQTIMHVSLKYQEISPMKYLCENAPLQLGNITAICISEAKNFKATST